MTFKKLSGMVLSVVFTAGTLLAWNAPASADRTIKLAGFGVKSGVVRSFGINTEAVLNAAVKQTQVRGMKTSYCACFKSDFFGSILQSFFV